MSPERSPGGQPFRIADRDREAAVQALGEHYATGRLDKAEYDERSELAWAARTTSDVAPLFTDLPAPHGNVVARVPVAPSELPARRWHSYYRVPFRRWVLLVVLLAVVLHAPWLIFFVLLAWVLRPGRRWR